MANDPNTIQYVIQEDGFWYVASKDRTPGVPEITVSAKGVANGLSTEYNDGWDFGPDSYDPTSTANPPYTQTSGIQEAFNYVEALAETPPTGYEVKLLTGQFNIYAPLQLPNANITFIGSAWRDGSYIVAQEAMTDMIVGGSGQYTISNIAFSGNNNATYIFNPTDIEDSVFLFKNVSYNTAVTGFINDTVIIASELLMYDLYEIGSTTYGLHLVNFSMATFVNCMFNSPCVFGASGTGGIVHLIGGGYFGGIENYTDVYATNIDLHELSAGDYSLTINSGSQTFITNSRLKTSHSTSYLIYDNGGLLTINGASYQLDATGSSTQYMIHRVSGANPSSSIMIKGMGVWSAVGSGDTVTLNIQDNPSTNSQTNIEEPIKTMPTAGTLVLNYPVLSLPANPPASGTVYQNTNPNDIEIDLPVYATTSGTAGYVTIAKGASSSSLTTIGNQFVNGSTSSTSVDIIRLRVPAGWYYEFTASGVTFGTASVFAD